MQRMISAAASGIRQMGQAIPHQLIDTTHGFTLLSVTFLSTVASRDGGIKGSSTPAVQAAVFEKRVEEHFIV
jgi:hypothetical protein